MIIGLIGIGIGLVGIGLTVYYNKYDKKQDYRKETKVDT